MSLFNNNISISNNGNVDVFIAKYDSIGTCLWAEDIGGTDYDYARSIAVDSNGNVYFTGNFGSNTIYFNNNISLSNIDYADVYIAKYNSSGTCQWAEKLGGNDYRDYSNSTIVNNEGDVYVVGSFDSSPLNFNNSISLTCTGSNDGFIAKYNKSGTCQWAQNIGGKSDDIPNSIAVDSSGNIYIAGSFNSDTVKFNNGISLYDKSIYGNFDIFIVKYNSSGDCLWAQDIGGSDYYDATRIVLDGRRNIFVSGYFFSSTLDFNNGISLTCRGKNDGFIAKYNDTGTCQWAQDIGGTNDDYVHSIAVDLKENVYFSGNFESATLNFNNGILLSNSGGFIAKYSDEPISVNEEPQTIQQISISPNPSNSFVNIKANLENNSKTEFIILNILGNEMLKFDSFQNGSFEREIDISNFPAGIYFLQVIRNDKVIIDKFIKY